MLAINGGEKIGIKSDLHWPLWDVNTQKELLSVLDSGRWAISGQWKGSKTKCELFEEQYALYNKIDYCVTFDHGSSSLVAALQALGIGPGDEVIVHGLRVSLVFVMLMQHLLWLILMKIHTVYL